MPDTPTIVYTAPRRLARALVDAGGDVERIIEALRGSITPALCEGCEIEVSEDDRAPSPGTAAGPRCAVLMIPGTGLLHGAVTVTRAEDQPAFEPRDLADIETYIAYATVAAEVALGLKAERELVRVARERAEVFHRTVLQIVGHDMRAPAAAILMSTEILVTQHTADRSLVEMVTRIASFANRMSSIVDRLNDVTQVELGGGIPLARSTTALPALVESVIEELSKRHPRNPFSLVGEAERRGIWDPDRLRQVIASLVANAVNHGAEEGPVRIFMSQDDLTTTFAVHNELRDEAIPGEALQQLFDLRRGRDDHGVAGQGLGLFVARAIVEAHGGKISGESTSAGTTFRVMLPAAR